MPTELQNPPQVSITIDGRPQAEHEAQKGGATVTQIGEGLCRRIVVHGRSITCRGRRYIGGETVDLAPEAANYHKRRGDVVHPEDFHATAQRAPSVRQVQGPDYGTR